MEEKDRYCTRGAFFSLFFRDDYGCLITLLLHDLCCQTLILHFKVSKH